MRVRIFGEVALGQVSATHDARLHEPETHTWGSCRCEKTRWPYFQGLCRSVRAVVTARGTGRDHPGKGRGDASPLTEKMLSANGEMSNIFLHKGQNIDIADKNRARAGRKLWKPGGISVLSSLTKRSALSGSRPFSQELSCPFYRLSAWALRGLSVESRSGSSGKSHRT